MVQAHRIKTLAVVGSTAVGKSDTALRLAREFGGEVVGADSMQIYRGFDVGTGKLTPQERAGVEHHLIDIVDGDAQFSVGEYVKLAKSAIADIHSRGKKSIIVGGTGLYVYSLLSGCDFADAPKNADVRDGIKLIGHFFGGGVLHTLLGRVDAQSAASISQNDVKRTVRALEIFAVSGTPKSEAVGYNNSEYDSLSIVLTLPRDVLYEKINERVHAMFESGLIEETKALLRYKNCGSMQALGYKQIAEFPDMPRDRLEELVAQKTRNYAKRQITYFKNMKLNKVFIDARDYIAVRKTAAEFWELS